MSDCTDGMNRNLPTLAFKDPDNTPEQCIQACEDLGYTYAGLQFVCAEEDGVEEELTIRETNVTVETDSLGFLLDLPNVMFR